MMSNVKDIRDYANPRSFGVIDGGSGGGDNGGMEARVAKLEDFAVETRDRLTRIETKLDTFATKEDLHKALNEQTWKFIGAMLTGCVILTTAFAMVVKYLLPA